MLVLSFTPQQSCEKAWETRSKGLGDSCTLTLALTTSRPTNHACLHRGDQLIRVLLPVEYFDICRLKDSHGTAAATHLALGAPPLVLADAAAAALLADAAHPPVRADAAAAALLAGAAMPSVLTDAAAATVLAPAAHPPVLAHAAAAALLAGAAVPPVLAKAAAAAVLAADALPTVLADAAAAAVLAPAALPPVLALLLSHFHVRPTSSRYSRPTFVQQGRRRATPYSVFPTQRVQWEGYFIIRQRAAIIKRPPGRSITRRLLTISLQRGEQNSGVPGLMLAVVDG